MDFNDTPEEAAFRAEARAWLAANAPAHEVPEGTRLDEKEQVAKGMAWMAALKAGGFGGITLPKNIGGRGGTTVEAVVFGEEEAKYRIQKGAFASIGVGMALPAILKHGTDEQKARFTAPTLNGDIVWCQLFSEPGAGSDLANLRTKAVRDGDDWIINGQKVWSSWAHHSHWAILAVRTDASVPKHKGLTFFVVDMKTPGIDVRPIRQISGASDFNETFLTDVRIPDSCRIGAVGEGWAVCMTVLMGERLNSGGGGHSKLAALIRLAGETPDGAGSKLDNAGHRLQLAEAYAEELAERYFQARLRTMVSRGENPGALAAMVKLASASRMQKTAGLAMEMRGLDALAPSADDTATRAQQADYIWATAMRVAGGADQVLRNQIAERVLGMPGDIRADKNVPFEDLR